MIDINELIISYSRIDCQIHSVYEITIAPNVKAMKGHTMKDMCGFIVPFRGKARYTIYKQPYILEPGTVLHAGSYMDLDKEVLSSCDWEYALIHYNINSPKKDKEFLEKACFLLNFEANQYSNILKIVHQLYQSEKSPKTFNKLRSKVLFYNMIESFMQSHQQKNYDSEENLMNSITKYIESNYDKYLTVNELALKNNMDVKHFYYVFQKCVGMSPKQFIMKCRINNAKELLLNSQYSIAEISLMVGYEDPLYFSRVFKKITGFSPTDFRKILGKNPW